MVVAPCRIHTCEESKSALGVGAQKYLVDLSQELLLSLALSKISIRQQSPKCVR
jgi:hypothetical protein